MKTRPGLADALFLFFFHRRLRRALRARLPRPAARALLADAAARAAAFRQGETHRLVDRASASHLSVCAAVAGCYLALRAAPATAGDALALTREVWLRTGASGTRWLMARLHHLTRDPFAFTVRVSRAKMHAYYGATFDHRIAQDDDQAYRMTVQRCFYHHFFLDHGLLELGPMFCEKDLDWADAIDPATHGFAFSRPCTLLTGGDCCRFEFHRSPR